MVWPFFFLLFFFTSIIYLKHAYLYYFHIYLSLYKIFSLFIIIIILLSLNFFLKKKDVFFFRRNYNLYEQNDNNVNDILTVFLNHIIIGIRSDFSVMSFSVIIDISISLALYFCSTQIFFSLKHTQNLCVSLSLSLFFYELLCCSLGFYLFHHTHTYTYSPNAYIVRFSPVSNSLAHAHHQIMSSNRMKALLSIWKFIDQIKLYSKTILWIDMLFFSSLWITFNYL